MFSTHYPYAPLQPLLEEVSDDESGAQLILTQPPGAPLRLDATILVGRAENVAYRKIARRVPGVCVVDQLFFVTDRDLRHLPELGAAQPNDLIKCTVTSNSTLPLHVILERRDFKVGTGTALHLHTHHLADEVVQAVLF